MTYKTTNFDLAIAYYSLGKITGKDLVELAINCLQEGYDSPSLKILAGEINPSLSDTAPLFENAINELKKKLPDNEEKAILRIAKFAANELANNNITELQCAEIIVEAGSNSSQAYVDKFDLLLSTYEATEEDNIHISESEGIARLMLVKEQIRKEAEKLLP